ncbi:enoyl-CoA hydratase/isomerase family protein [Streptomyces sp. RM72]|uniref:enoyl-CoA hydratase/isomerase family protein n=1 Tax=unclassified Streptomyces TaxID=2593676 RepID=UPI000EF58824|nr:MULTISPECIES: enoyl-CoA hydratase/isomerase family protein [unclassified Streptomyces]MBQ0887061.1 enoyl-CoA hydratase/isomerase family protein [Streptomyces sp. RM72]
MSAHDQFSVEEISPSYWRVTFSNGEINLIDPDTIEQLAALITRIEQAPELTAVVFRSANPDFFMAHWDMQSDRSRVAAMQPAPSGLHPFADNLYRLAKVPAATISEINGRARGAGSEFVLATDIRFAGPGAVLGQFEVGVGSVPGGNPTGRLPRLVGRGRALEILLGADDFPADLAAAYGYVNRVVADGELEQFVDGFARRVAGFDKVAVARIKSLVDVESLPTEESYGASLQAFFQTSGRPENAHRVRSLFERGLQRPDGVELDLGRRLAE